MHRGFSIDFTDTLCYSEFMRYSYEKMKKRNFVHAAERGK